MADTLQKRCYSTSSPWEARIGYCRAVRQGQNIYVSGTTAADPNSPPEAPRVQFPGDALKQARATFEEIVQSIQAVGGKGAENVVRCRMFITRKEDSTAVGEAFKEYLGKGQGEGFGAVATMVVVAGFVDDEMLVEIEVDAIA
ncbi:Chitin synthase C [Penicillium taxi]|uniref:Chitin synthase C n=1 Tax=Penicillium taxi TaxID=168475 RepID=UPI00254551E1|nr:Chitin synthase C [Penicillium taxi]KAJ5908465.1 Chitin synthase C [Penicillium taxi]